MTLACEDANSKLVEVVTVADVDDEDHVSNSLLQIWELTFGPSDFEHKGWSRFWLRFLVDAESRYEDEIRSRFVFELAN